MHIFLAKSILFVLKKTRLPYTKKEMMIPDLVFIPQLISCKENKYLLIFLRKLGKMLALTRPIPQQQLFKEYSGCLVLHRCT